MILSDKVYKILKWIALIALPAIGTFYSTIGAVWNLPYTAEVAKTLQAVGTLIGVLIGVSAMKQIVMKTKQDISCFFWR